MFVFSKVLGGGGRRGWVCVAGRRQEVTAKSQASWTMSFPLRWPDVGGHQTPGGVEAGPPFFPRVESRVLGGFVEDMGDRTGSAFAVSRT